MGQSDGKYSIWDLSLTLSAHQQQASIWGVEKLLANCLSQHWLGFWEGLAPRGPFFLLQSLIFTFLINNGWFGFDSKCLLSEGKSEPAAVTGEKVKVSRCAGLSFWASHPSATLVICFLGSSEAEGLLLPNSQLASLPSPSQCTGTYLPG